jgi:hypothetical protein
MEDLVDHLTTVLGHKYVFFIRQRQYNGLKIKVYLRESFTPIINIIAHFNADTGQPYRAHIYNNNRELIKILSENG